VHRGNCTLQSTRCWQDNHHMGAWCDAAGVSCAECLRFGRNTCPPHVHCCQPQATGPCQMPGAPHAIQSQHYCQCAQSECHTAAFHNSAAAKHHECPLNKWSVMAQLVDAHQCCMLTHRCPLLVVLSDVLRSRANTAGCFRDDSPPASHYPGL
jgi:hypothetical protein